MSLSAATDTWTGGGANGLWNNAANWGGTAPSAGDDLVFAGSTNLITSNTYTAATSFHSITFSASAGAFTLAGNAITLAGNLTNSSTQTQLLTLAMVVSGATTITCTTNPLTVTGVLSGSGSLTLTGASSLTVGGSNTYSGGTTITQGTLYAGGYGLGSGLVTVSSGAVLSVSGSSGLAARYYNETPVAANFASLTTLLTHLGTVSLALGNAPITLNMGTTGTAFPAPYTTTTSTPADFEAVYSGKLTIASAGVYTFNTSSDDGSMLWVDGTLVVSNNFTQGITTRTGTITLAVGVHDLVVAYYQGTGSDGFTAQISGAGNTTMTDISTANATIAPDLVISSLAGSGSVVLSAGNLVVGLDNTSTTFSGSISGIGELVKTGTGTLTLGGTNTYSDTTIIANGVLKIGANAAAGTLGSAAVTNSGTLQFNRSDVVTVGNVISGAGTVVMSGSGTLTLSGANTYTGGTTISQGTIDAGAYELSSGLVTVSAAGTLALTGDSGLAGRYYNETPVAANFATSTQLAAHLGTQTLILGDNPLTLNMGTTGTAFPSPYTTTTSSPSNFEAIYSGKIAIPTTGTYTFNTSSDDGSMLWIDGTAVVTANQPQSYTTHTGSIALSQGVHDLVVGYYNDTGNDGLDAQISGAGNTTMVDLSTATQTLTADLVISSLSGSGAVALTNGNLVVGLDNTSTTFSGVISGPGGVVKSGTGTLTLSGANTYSDSTLVGSGTLILPSGGGLGNSAVTVMSAATLAANPVAGTTTLGTGSAGTGSSLVLNAGSTFSMVDGGIGTCSVQQGTGYAGTALTISGATLAFELSSTGADTLAASLGASVSGTNTIAITGLGSSLTLTGTYNLITAASGLNGGTWQFSNGGSASNITVGGNNYTLSLTVSATAVAITVSSGIDVWNGTVSTDWNNAANWGLNMVPDYGHNVQIGTGTGTYYLAPSVTSGNGTCNSITFSSAAATIGAGGGTLTIGSGGIMLGVTGCQISAPVALGAGQTWALSSNALTINGVISGAFPLTETGTGTLTLLGTNTYSGTTTISGGTLQIGNGGTTGTFGTGAVVDAGTVTVMRSNALTVANTISGTGALLVNGSGTITLSAANTFSGGTTISVGTVDAWSSALGTGRVTVSSGAILSASGTSGLAARYYNETPSTTNYTSLGVLQSHLGAVTVAMVDTPTTLNMGSSGTAFPAPYTTISSAVLDFDAFYTGRLTIATGGVYTFSTSSDDGSMLWVDGTTVVNSDFGQSYTTRTGTITLTAGVHDLAVGYFQITGNDGLDAQISGAGNTTMVDISTANATICPDLLIGSLAGAGSVQLTTGNLVVGLDNTSSTFSGVISGSGGLLKSGSGTLTVTGTNSYTGTTTIATGALQIGNGTTDGSITTSGSIVDNATLGFNLVQASQTYPSVISGIGSVTLSGTQALILTAADTYSGATTISGGTLQIGNGTTDGSVSGTSGITDNAALVFDLVQANQAFTKVIAGTGTVTLSGAETLALTGTCTYTGATTISGGTLQIGNGTTDGSILTSSGITDNAALVFDLVQANQTVTKVIGGTGTLTLSGAETLTLTGTCTYSGATTITGGTLQIGNGTTDGSIASTSSIADNAALVIDLVQANQSYGQVISGTGTLTLSGSKKLTLTGASTYAGATSVSAGTLILGPGGSLGNTAISVAAAASFAPNPGSGACTNGTTASGSAGATLTLASGATFSLVDGGIGSCALVQNSGFSGTAVTISGATLAFEIGSGGSDALTVGNAATVTGTNTVALTALGTSLPLGTTALLSATSGVNGGTWQFSGGGTSMGITVGSNHYTETLSASTTTLSVSVTNPVDVWNGNLSSDWNVAGNWSLNQVPAANQAVQIGNGVGANATTPSLTASGGTCASITFLSAASTIGAGGGTLTIGSGGITASISGSAIACPVALGASQSWATSSTTLTVSGLVSGAFALTKSGSGTLILSGANTYSGGTSIATGTLQLGTGAANGTICSGSYAIASGARLYLDYATAIPSGTGTWSNNLSGSGLLELNSAQAVNGTAQWGPNSGSATVFAAGFTGTLQVDNGRFDGSPTGLGGLSALVIASNAQFLAWTGTYAVPITIAGNGWGESGEPGALRASGGSPVTWNAGITLSAGAGISAQNGAVFTLTGAITGAFALELETSSFSSGTIHLTPAAAVQNAYASTQIDSGATVTTGNAYALSTGGLTMNGGLLELLGFSATVANLSGGGTIENATGSASATLTVGTDGSSTSFSGSLTDAGAMPLAITKVGTGTLTLTGGSSASGATTISSGTLILGSGGSLGNTPISVASAATFAATPGTGTAVIGTTAAGSAGGTLTLNSGAIVSMVDGGIGTCAVRQEASFSGSALVLAGATLNVELGTSAADVLAITGAASVSGTNTVAVTCIGSSLTAGSTPVITAASGLNAGTWQFSGGGTSAQVTVGGTPYVLTLSSSATAVTLTVVPAVSIAWTNGSNPKTWALGSLNVATVANSISSGLNLGITNTGGDAVVLSIASSAASPSGWLPAATAALNSFVLGADASGAAVAAPTASSSYAVILTTSAQTLLSSLAAGTTCTLGLYFQGPTSISSGAATSQTITVTITAALPP